MEPTPPLSKPEPGIHQGTPDPTQPQKEAPSSRLIRTMKNDIDEAIKKQNETIVSVALVEERKQAKLQKDAAAARQAQIDNAPPVPKRIGRLVIVLILLIIISLSALAYIFILPKLSSIKIPKIIPSSFDKPSTTTVVPVTTIVEPLASSLLPAQSEKRFTVSQGSFSQIVAAITEEAGKGMPSGSIKNLYFTEWEKGAFLEISASRLLTFLNSQASDSLTRSLEKQFMMGFFGESNGGATPFLVLKVSDHDMALAGMLEWETNIPLFFNTLFRTKINSDPTMMMFRDVIVLGKNARVLDTTYNESVAYAFANQTTMVITGSLTSLESLLLLAAKN